MNKNKFAFLIVLFLIIISIPKVSAVSVEPYQNKETNYRVIIEDDAQLLTVEEINKLKEEMIPLTTFGNIAFKTIATNSYGSTANFASMYYHNTFGTSSGTLFLIDMAKRNIYIFSDGSNYKAVTVAKANIITDNVYIYATNAKYYKCASMAFSQINSVLKGEKIAEPMRYISNIFIATTVAFFINFMIVLANTKIKKAGSKKILSNCTIDFNMGNVTPVKTGTFRVYSPVSSDSGSGSSGGGGGGGGSSSSGGGGGHSF